MALLTKEEIDRVLDEYLFSLSAAEVARRLAAAPPSPPDLNVGVEVVKRAVYLVLSRKLSDGEKLASLVVQLVLQGVISYDHVLTAMRVMAWRLPDAALDHPSAAQAILSFAEWLVVSDVLDEDFLSPAHTAEILGLAEAAHVPAVPALPPYITAFHDKLGAALRNRQPHALLALRGMQREELQCYLASGGMAIEALIDTVASPSSAGGLGPVTLYTRHELARTLWLAVARPRFYEERADDAYSLPPKRPYLQRVHSEPRVGPGGGPMPALSPANSGTSSSAPFLPSEAVVELCLHTLGELLGKGLLSAWDMQAGLTAALIDTVAMGALEGEAAAAFGRVIGRTVSAGGLPKGWLDQPHLAVPPFANAWARGLAAERVHTGEWVVVRDTAGISRAEGFAPVAAPTSVADVLAVARQGWPQPAPGPWCAPKLRQVARDMGRAVVAELAAGGTGDKALAALPAAASDPLSIHSVLSELTAWATAEAVKEEAVHAPALAAAVATTVTRYGLPEASLRAGLGRALEALLGEGGPEAAAHVPFLGDLLAGLVTGGALPSVEALWTALPRSLLLARRLDLEAGEGGPEYLGQGSAAAFLSAIEMRAEDGVGAGGRVA